MRDIVRRSSGFLAVESVEGQGTRFEIYLPRRWRLPSAPTTPAAAAAVACCWSKTIRWSARLPNGRCAAPVGPCVCAGSAEDALEVLQGADCDLMISDVALPGMDGVALARLVLERQPGLPVILTSGYARAADGGDVANVVF